MLHVCMVCSQLRFFWLCLLMQRAICKPCFGTGRCILSFRSKEAPRDFHGGIMERLQCNQNMLIGAHKSWQDRGWSKYLEINSLPKISRVLGGTALPLSYLLHHKYLHAVSRVQWLNDDIRCKQAPAANIFVSRCVYILKFQSLFQAWPHSHAALHTRILKWSMDLIQCRCLLRNQSPCFYVNKTCAMWFRAIKSQVFLSSTTTAYLLPPHWKHVTLTFFFFALLMTLYSVFCWPTIVLPPRITAC